jgi:[acyl-carrier-protein] S-malonyltransferase
VVKAVVLCPGQGAQRVGMGKDLAERFPAAREVFAAIDDALGFSLSRVMWEGPEAELTLTHNTQPAILAHGMAVAAVVGKKIQILAGAGHSLGEYTAYAAAGSLTSEDAARLVRKRGELMHRAGEERPGTMAAVLGLATGLVARACQDASEDGEVAVPANLNTPDQTVISGDPAAVDRAGENCKAAGAKRVVPLKVSGAFHSPLMAPAQQGLRAELEKMPFNRAEFPVVANATAQPVKDVADAKRLLDLQLVSPVRWVECMQKAAEIAGPDVTFVEIGPGNVLAGLLKRIVPTAKAISLGTADDVSKFLELN